MIEIPQKYLDVDWTQQDCQIAEDLGITNRGAHYWRQRLGKPRPENYHKWRYAAGNRQSKYGHLDFENKRDVDLAKDAGISRERIRQLRGLFKRPVSALYKCSTMQVEFMTHTTVVVALRHGAKIDLAGAMRTFPWMNRDTLVRYAKKFKFKIKV